MTRICPNCQAKLGGYDYFFCTTCGNELPKDLVNRQGSFLRVANFAVASKTSEPLSAWFKNLLSEISQKLNFKAFFIYLFGVVFLVSGVFFIIPKLTSSFSKTQSESPTSQVQQLKFSKSTIELPIDWKSNTFGVNKIMEYVPFDAQIVIEGSDLSKFAQFYVQMDSAYGNMASLWAEKTDNHFVFFANKVGTEYKWAMILYPKTKDFPIPAEIISEYRWLKFWKNDPILLLTTDERTLTSVIDSKGKTQKNFSQTPMYTSSRAVLPKSGKMLLYFASQDAKDYFKGLSNLPGLPQEAKTALETISKKDSDFVAIL